MRYSTLHSETDKNTEGQSGTLQYQAVQMLGRIEQRVTYEAIAVTLKKKDWSIYDGKSTPEK